MQSSEQRGNDSTLTHCQQNLNVKNIKILSLQSCEFSEVVDLFLINWELVHFSGLKVWNLNVLNLDYGVPRAKGKGHFLWFLRSLSPVLEVFLLVFTTV